MEFIFSTIHDVGRDSPMYAVDELDSVLERFDLPQACTCAPRASVFADEDNVSIAYATQKGCNGPLRAGTQYAVVTFLHYAYYMSGQPKGNVLSRHPLYPKGLEPFSFSEVIGSSWLRQLAALEAPDACRKETYRVNCRHFILAFRDSTFECAAQGYCHTLFEGNEQELVAHMSERHACMRAR